MNSAQQTTPKDMTIEAARQKFACTCCEAETADECICDDLNFADEYCECGEHNKI